MAAAKRKKKNTRKKNRRRKASRGPSQALRLLFAALFLALFVGLCLYGLVSLQRSYSPSSARVEVVTPMEEERVELNHETPYDDVYALLEDELLTGSLSQGWKRLDGDQGIERLQMFGTYPDPHRLMELQTRIAVSNSPAQLELAPRTGFVRLLWKGQVRVELVYPVDHSRLQQRPKIAIIMDDMGRSLRDFETLIHLKVPVTPAILPYTDYATRATSLLRSAGREYMIHIPMEPKSYPATNPGRNALLVGLSEKEIRRRMQHYLQQVPGAVGGNNHMGSRFTLKTGPMRVVLDELRRSDLFFVDSRTIGGSVAYAEARKMGLRTATRQVFLDNEEDVTYIRRQLRKAVKVAIDRGEAIAICHPYRETFEALRSEVDWLRQQKVDFVEASQVVRTD
ncbi:MAG: hypothetical protein C0618_08875 [Desulfuromonas sp.]|nr:MAG: hypothetical protein C0618_08875 [Desulfuromonas sp.]